MSKYNIVNESDYALSWFDDSMESSPNYDLEADNTLAMLRISSHKLLKNEAIANGALNAFLDGIIGGEIKTTVFHKSKSKQKKIQAFLDDRLTKLDVNGKLSLTNINTLLVSSAFSDGDILILLPVDSYGNTYVELIDASRIKTPPMYMDNYLVRNGVQYYKNGKLKGYWILKGNSFEKNNYSWTDEDFFFFPVEKKVNTSIGTLKRKVAYLFEAQTSKRVNQGRQVPVLTPVMELIRYYGKYLEAVLVGARVSACYSAFVKTTNPSEARKSLAPITNKKGKKVQKLQPGTISYLRPNEDITFASPNKPSDNFDDFIMRLQKIFSMSLRFAFPQMFLDLKGVTYSSWRGGSLETIRTINRWRAELKKVNTWIINTFLLEEVSKLNLKVSLKDIKIKFRFPTYKSLDEEKTARANRLRLESKTASKQMVSEEEGTNWEDLQDEILDEALFDIQVEAEKLKLEKEFEDEYGIQFDKTADNSKSKKTDEQAREQRKSDGNW